jgi:hypothetical protein
MNEKTFFIPVGTKKYPLIITETGKIDPEEGEIVHITCDILHLNQSYLKSDLPLLFMDIGRMIEEELSQKADSNLHIRLKNSEKMLIEQKAQKEGFTSISEFVKEKLLA